MRIPGSENHQIDELRQTLYIIDVMTKKAARLRAKIEARRKVIKEVAA